MPMSSNASFVGASIVNGPPQVKISCKFAASISVKNMESSGAPQATSRTLIIQSCPPVIPSKSYSPESHTLDSSEKIDNT